MLWGMNAQGFRGRIRTTRNAADVREGKREWFRFENKAGEQAEIYIYDEVSWWGITAQDFIRELKGVTAKSISLRLNSPGGDVFDGIAIYNALRGHPATVNVTVDGIAASIASVIAQSGDTVTMSRGSMLMIHEPFAFVIGDAEDMRKQAAALDIIGDNIAGIYADRAGGSAEYWRGLMHEETWFGDQAAVDAKLADGVGAGTAAGAENRWDLSIFRNYPGANPGGGRAAAAARNEAVARVTRDWRMDARFAVAAAELGLEVA